MAKWGKMEFGKKGPDGIKGEGIDESSQGELYEKNNEIISQGDEMKKLLESIKDEDDTTSSIVSEEEKSDFEKSLEGNNVEAIKEASERLKKVFYEISEKLYTANQAAANAEGAEEAASNDGTVYDADYKVEEENKDEENN